MATRKDHPMNLLASVAENVSEEREETIIRLAPADFDRAMEILKDDSPPNDLLRAEAAKYRADLASGRVISRS